MVISEELENDEGKSRLVKRLKRISLQQFPLYDISKALKSRVIAVKVSRWLKLVNVIFKPETEAHASNLDTD